MGRSGYGYKRTTQGILTETKLLYLVSLLWWWIHKPTYTIRPYKLKCIHRHIHTHRNECKYERRNLNRISQLYQCSYPGFAKCYH